MEHELRDKFAFYNFEAFAQIDKTLRRKCNTYKNNFVDFAKAQSQSLSEVNPLHPFPFLNSMLPGAYTLGRCTLAFYRPQYRCFNRDSDSSTKKTAYYNTLVLIKYIKSLSNPHIIHIFCVHN